MTGRLLSPKLTPEVAARLEVEFYTAPEDRGQIVTYSYAADWELDRIVRRCFDASDRTTSYDVAAADIQGEFEPWNGAGNLRDLDWRPVE